MSPGLVVVSGLPATGKTTLSARLAEELGFVHVQRDLLSRPLAGVRSALGPGGSAMVPQAIDELTNVFLRSVLVAGHGVVVDCNFNTPEPGKALRALVRDLGPPCFEICLWGDPDVLRRRFVQRADPPLTEELRPYFERVLSRERRPVLGPPVPTVEFDTTDFSVLERATEGLAGDIRAALEVEGRAPHDSP
jgi:predicted kinase